jgi:hypothetical protein
VRGLGHDAKHDFYDTRFRRAHHVSGNRWAIINSRCNPLVIQDVVTGAIMRVKLDALHAGEDKQAAFVWATAAMTVIGPKRLVVMVSSPQVAVGVVDADSGKVLKRRMLGCPPLGKH